MIMWCYGPGGSSPVDVGTAGIQGEKALGPYIVFQGTHLNELMMGSSQSHILEVLLLPTSTTG